MKTKKTARKLTGKEPVRCTGMVVRACVTKDVRERTWWVVEWMSSDGEWHETNISARISANECIRWAIFHNLDTWKEPWRVAEVVERRKVVAIHGASSHNDQAQRHGEEKL